MTARPLTDGGVRTLGSLAAAHGLSFFVRHGCNTDLRVNVTVFDAGGCVASGDPLASAAVVRAITTAEPANADALTSGVGRARKEASRARQAVQIDGSGVRAPRTRSARTPASG
jgi:hypothetical protein